MKQILKMLIFVFILQENYCSMAQIIVKLTDIPLNTPESKTIYATGNFNYWNPSDSNYVMIKKGNNYITKIETDLEIIELKFTLGSWNNVETDEFGNDIQNRKINSKTEKKYECKIVQWKTLEGKISTRANNVSILTDSFYMPQLERYRRIWLYLPPDYNETDKKYPVLYMHDGQNLFDELTSFSGEWNVDETLNLLYDSLGFAIIVVGIDNGGDFRKEELTPWENSEFGGGNGKKYSAFIVETLKPYIDANYRTLSDRENTGIFGSSLGGLISFYIGLQYDDVFSKIGAFSPSFWFSKEIYKFAEEKTAKNNLNIYFLAGGKESARMYNDMENMIEILKENEFYNIDFKKVANGKHHEIFWSKNFKEAILKLWNL